MAEARRQTFPRKLRLSGRRAFSAVFDARMRKNVGPLAFVARPNGLTHARLGLSVGRGVGTAVVRHRIKRLIREAFRLQQHDLPHGYDVVVVVRPHEQRTLTEYSQWLQDGFAAIDAAWQKRAAKSR